MTPEQPFDGRYEIRSLLGQGGFATVYLAWDSKTQRDVVLKILSPDIDGTYPATVTARFHREAQIFASLEEPHIVTMYDFGSTAEGLLYMVFEFVEGRELTALLHKGPVPPDITKHILIQLLEALREAHRHGVLHRDIKPANILIYSYRDDPFRVKLIDFGVAKELAPDATRLTKTGNVVGTLRYMSPEQVFGEPVSPATDLFCLGMVAWEMLMGRPLISGADKAEMLKQHAQLETASLPLLDDPPLHDAILRALQLAPSNRFASAAAMLAAIRAPQSPAQPSPTPEAIAPSSAPRMSPEIRVGLIAAFVVTLGVGGWLSYQGEQEPPSPTVALERDVTALTEEEIAAPVAEDLPNESAPKPLATASGTKCERPPPFYGKGKLGPSLMGKRISAYIPKRYAPADPPGLVLAFHRGLRSGMEMIKYTEIAEHAEEHNWVVIAPNATLYADWTHDPDVAFDAIEAAVDELCIDRTELHIMGDEGGVSYARRIACQIPVSSVVASYAPGAFGQCEPTDPFPYLRIQTRQDKLHPRNGRGCQHKLVGRLGGWDEIEGSTRRRLHCTGDSAAPWEPFPDACRQSTDCPEVVVTCGFDGGHRWPASPGERLPYQGCDDPKTEAPLMDAAAHFMSQHGRKLTAAQVQQTNAAIGISDSNDTPEK